jgi:hypothetical protein
MNIQRQGTNGVGTGAFSRLAVLKVPVTQRSRAVHGSLICIRSEAVLVSRFKASHQPGLDEEFEYDNEQQIRM